MKLLAIVNMTVDHIGAFLFPDLLWLRAIGRITFPVWFYLVGFSRGREIGPLLWSYALILVLIHPFVGLPVFPVNALATVILCRLMLNLCEKLGWTEKRMLELAVWCIFLSIPTMPLFEYGTVAFMYALIGRLVRTEARLTMHYKILVGLAYATFMGWQFLNFNFDLWQNLYVLIGTGLVVLWLARGHIRPLMQDWTRNFWMRPVVILARNTLPYYFYHRIVLQVLNVLLFTIPPAHEAFRWFGG